MSATREHITNLADVFAHRAIETGAMTIGIFDALEIAEEILTSTDPAVHAAMLDALVRAGYVYKAKQLTIVAVELAAASNCSPQDALETFVQAMQEVVTHAHD